MKNIFTLTLILALGAPAAAELAAPQLQPMDAAHVRAGLADRAEMINVGAAFPGMQVCKFAGSQGDTCSFACKDGSTVKRPRIDSSVAQNGGCALMVMVPAGAPKAAAIPVIRKGVYTNGKGCLVEAENRANGTVLYVEDQGRRATLGVLKDLSGGDIAAFCRPAAASFDGAVLTLGCQEQNNGGLSTRGSAELDLRSGLSAVRVTGEVRKALGWKTDTEIVCENLRPR